MILYNVTVGIDKQFEAEWLQWMVSEHIPKVMATGMFLEQKIYKVLSHMEEGTSSYSIQYFSDSMDKLEIYLNEFAPDLTEEHRAKFKDKHVAFRTLLQEVE